MRNAHFHVAPTDLFIIICSYLNFLECIERCARSEGTNFFSLGSYTLKHARSFLIFHHFVAYISKYSYLKAKYKHNGNTVVMWMQTKDLQKFCI